MRCFSPSLPVKLRIRPEKPVIKGGFPHLLLVRSEDALSMILARIAILLCTLAVLGYPPSVVGGAATGIIRDSTHHATRWQAYFSSTPKGGKDYLSAQAAADRVRRIGLAQGSTVEIIDESHRTGYFCVAEAFTQLRTPIFRVGYGRTQVEADHQAIRQVDYAAGARQYYILKRFFSYGDEKAR